VVDVPSLGQRQADGAHRLDVRLDRQAVRLALLPEALGVERDVAGLALDVDAGFRDLYASRWKMGLGREIFFRSAILRFSAVAVETRASRGRERVAEKVTGFIPVGRGVNPVHRLGLRLG
jgi:hypothetical protein